MPATRHWQLLQAFHAPRGGQLTRLLDGLSPADRDDPRPDARDLRRRSSRLGTAARAGAVVLAPSDAGGSDGTGLLARTARGAA